MNTKQNINGALAIIIGLLIILFPNIIAYLIGGYLIIYGLLSLIHN